MFLSHFPIILSARFLGLQNELDLLLLDENLGDKELSTDLTVPKSRAQQNGKDTGADSHTSAVKISPGVHSSFKRAMISSEKFIPATLDVLYDSNEEKFMEEAKVRSTTSVLCISRVGM